MKKRNIITASALSLATIALAAGFAFNAYAQTATATAIKTTSAKTSATVNHPARIKPETMTAEQKAAFEAQRATMEKELAAKLAAMQTAVNSGSYDTFVKTVKAQFGEKSPLLEKVTADNFSQFAEAYKLAEQAQEKFKAIGIDGNLVMGMERGHEHGFGGHKDAGSVPTDTTVTE